MDEQQFQDVKIKVIFAVAIIRHGIYAEEFQSPDDLTDKAVALTDLNDILPTRFIDTVIKVLKI